jgi:SepF-like predicted cell division protein (DUF552 family)
MDWGVVVSGGITGAVGIAGIGGSILSAKVAGKLAAQNLQTSIGAENERTKLTEKRRIYARHLAACTELAKERINYITQPEVGGAAKLAALSDYLTAGAAVIAATAEVQLIAPDDVARLADEVRVALPHFEPSAARKAGDYIDLLMQLISVMRADLGEPVPDEVQPHASGG